VSRTLGFFAAASGGQLAGADGPFLTVSTDSRTLAAGDLFVALQGERFDGHDYAAAAAARGACAAVVSRRLALGIPQIIVDDPLVALGAAARAWRGRFTLPLVSVGGSNGKTTTKELLAAILRRSGAALATQGNLNNHIGVPLTLLRLERGHRAAVVEMGANHAGEIAALVGLARPTVGLVTNAGAEHLEGFGSLEGVAHAEGEMFAGLDSGATAVINADDEFRGLWQGMSKAGRSVTFGLGEGADFCARPTSFGVENSAWVSRFELDSPAGHASARLALPGRHNVLNAVAAAAAAWACSATLEDIVAGLGEVRPVSGRLELKPLPGGAWLIDDTYNANPSSVLAGLEVLGGLDGERWLVLGEMAELGEHAVAAHADIALAARRSGVSRLFAVGAATRPTVEAFGTGGRWFADGGALTTALAGAASAGTTVLVKGSRVNRLERVVGALVAPPAAAGNGH
jgi:UDP-N-acetylmuramoyl-tripeptide--D-alanyl-D-alanine ligase